MSVNKNYFGFSRGDFVEFEYLDQKLRGTLLNIYPTPEGHRIGVLLNSGQIFNTFYSKISNLYKIPKFEKLKGIKIGDMVTYTLDVGWELIGNIGKVTNINQNSVQISGYNKNIDQIFSIAPMGGLRSKFQYI